MARFVAILFLACAAVVAAAAIPTGSCEDGDGDGYCVADDCDDSDPNCNTDCTDADGDGFCLPYDCDDGTPHLVDADLDGVPDACDNCPGTANQDQSELWEIQSVISTEADGAQAVLAADIDGDGDADLLSASALNDTIAWYENTDGLGSFGPRQTISVEADVAQAVLAADVDGDTDVDVLSVSVGDGKVAWYENLDGTGSFGAQQTICSPTVDVTSAVAADLDGDLDIDVAVASFDGTIAWCENVDGAGLFGPQQVISTEAEGAYFLLAAHVNEDVDVDLLFASVTESTIAWFENTGSAGGFGPLQVISTAADGARSVFAADLDGDDDQDVLSASFNDDTIAWYENLDSAGGFGPRQVISDTTDGAFSLFVTDVDDDSDLDVLSAAFLDDTIAWYENLDGAGSFGPPRAITVAADGATSVVATDLDDDDVVDVLSASQNDDRIVRYAPAMDGVGDVCDNCPTSVNPTQDDVDTDGPGDACDNCPAIPNGGQEDADADGFGDVCDNCVNTPSPDQSDGDGDGAGDPCDNCNGLSNPDQTDSDGDDFGDVCDNCPQTSSPDQSDADGDGLGAPCDNCPVVNNPLQPDGDLDNVGDVCDNCPGQSNHGQADDDDDGFGDVCDNCPGVSNPTQFDGDDDGVGDACDNCPVDDNSNQADLDGDGVGNLCDNCPGDANAPQSDVDADGIGDACDNCPAVFNPDQSNADGDALGDLCDCAMNNPLCSTDCTDLDGDGFCAPEDCSDSLPNCDSDCSDADEDGFCPPHDCDDTLPHLSDVEGDGVPDACDNCPETSNRGQTDFDEFGPTQVISTEEDGAYSVVAADLDGDGDRDVISANLYGTTKIRWYENLDGLGNLGPYQAVEWGNSGVRCVVAVDLDGDSDLDILAALHWAGQVAWYENQDGLGDFGPRRTISASVDFPWWVFAADLDGDSDLDVLSASEEDDKVAWYENTDGLGSFGPQQLIDTTADRPLSVFAADLDGDNDQDVLSASFNDHTISWYENLDGQGDFGPRQIVSATEGGAFSVTAADMDGDSDLDVVSASFLDDEIAWFENLDGGAAFGPQQLIYGFASGALEVFASDVDGDGDVDVLSAASFSDAIAWYENLGGAAGFELHLVSVTANGASSVFAADLDGDSGTDLLSASSMDDTIAWYPGSGDGVGDACDNCPRALNPYQPDLDLDGFGDVCDNCPVDTNASQADADADGAGDSCDCAPADPATTPAAEVDVLIVEHLGSGSAQLSWMDVPGADSYSVTRGLLSEIDQSQYGDCLIEGLVDPEHVDTDVPVTGTGYGYLVQAINGCGSGPLGFTAGGGLRINVDPGACP